MVLFLFVILAVSFVLLAWAWVGYPLLLAGLARRVWSGACPGIVRRSRERGVRSPESRTNSEAQCVGVGGCGCGSGERQAPGVSIVIAAHNEEKVIRARLDNLVACDPPAGDYEILLGCDGCDDRTAEIVKAWSAERGAGVGESTIRLRLFEFAERRGKPAVLKDLVAAGAGDILVFSDANTMFAEDAIPQLLAPLADADIGGVCGRLIFVDHGAASRENLYWRFETWLKTRESAVDSCLGANGAIYALRRELFWQDLPPTAIIDDFVLGMKVRQQGKRMLYAPQAVAYEDLPATVDDEWRRRIRIGAGDYQAVGLCRGCLLPRHGFFALAFFSHKLLRWFTPHLMLVVLLASLGGLFFRADSFPVRLIFALLVTGQGLWYALALAGGRSHSWLRAIYYFTTMQLALLCGFGRYLAGIRSGAWQRTAR